MPLVLTKMPLDPLDQLLKEFLTKKKEGEERRLAFPVSSILVLPLSLCRLIAPFLLNTLIQVSKEVSSSSCLEDGS